MTTVFIIIGATDTNKYIVRQTASSPIGVNTTHGTDVGPFCLYEDTKKQKEIQLKKVITI